MNLTKRYNYILEFYINRYKSNESKNVSVDFSKSYIERITIILKFIVKSIIRLLTRKKEFLSVLDNTKIWLFVLSYNNITALEFLKNYYKNKSHFISFSSQTIKDLSPQSLHSIIAISNYSMHHNFKWLVHYICVLFKTTNKNRMFYLKYPNLFFKSYISTVKSNKLFKDYNPEVIVFSNDVNAESRALNLVARLIKIPTVYIQHATVTSLFPKLDFNLAMLEGTYSENIYSKNKNTIVRLIGQPKFEEYKSERKTVNSIKIVGVAFNKIDNLSDVQRLITFLTQKEFEVYLRAHPGENRKESLYFENIKYYSSKDENSYQFLKKIDLLVASDSSIHIEATLFNIPSVYFNLNRNYYYDIYNYVENEIIFHAKNHLDLYSIITEINKRDNSTLYKKAKYYCASTNTETASIQLAIDGIESIRKRNV